LLGVGMDGATAAAAARSTRFVRGNGMSAPYILSAVNGCDVHCAHHTTTSSSSCTTVTTTRLKCRNNSNGCKGHQRSRSVGRMTACQHSTSACFCARRQESRFFFSETSPGARCSEDSAPSVSQMARNPPRLGW